MGRPGPHVFPRLPHRFPVAVGGQPSGSRRHGRCRHGGGLILAGLERRPGVGVVPATLRVLEIEHQVQGLPGLRGKLASDVCVPFGQTLGRIGHLGWIDAGTKLPGLHGPQFVEFLDDELSKLRRGLTQGSGQGRTRHEIGAVGVTGDALPLPGPGQRSLLHVGYGTAGRELVPDRLLGRRGRDQDLLPFILWLGGWAVFLRRDRSEEEDGEEDSCRFHNGRKVTIGSRRFPNEAPATCLKSEGSQLLHRVRPDCGGGSQRRTLGVSSRFFEPCQESFRRVPS